MLSRILRSLGQAILVGLICVNSAHAQKDVSTDLSEPNSTPVKERPASVVYIEREDGELVAIVGGVPWSRFDELANLSAEEQDGFSLTRLSMKAEAKAKSITIVNQIELDFQKPGNFRIPIQMGECNFLSQPKIVASSESKVVARFVEERNEYELLIDCRQSGKLTIEFPTELALRQLGQRKLLSVSLPRALVSLFQLDVPESNIEGKSGTGMVVEAASNGDATTFTINGLMPQFEFWWLPKGIEEDARAFTVSGQIEASVNDYGEISRTVTLATNSFGRPLDGFVVELPSDAKWVPPSDPTTRVGYSVNLLSSEEGRESLQIVFDDPSAGPVPVRLRFHDREQADSDVSRICDLSGFRVSRATSQSGTVRVISEGSWRLEYELGNFSRRIDNTDADKNAIATFEYSQPGQVHLRVSRQTAELIVEPLYLLTLEETTARLIAKFRCTRRGARVTELDIDMRDWIFQSLGPNPNEVVMQIDELLAPSNGVLRLPLDSTSEKFEITVIASRSINGGLPRTTKAIDDESDDQELEGFDESQMESFASLEFDFPQVRGTTTLLPSLVALSSDTNVVATSGQTDDYAEIAMPERVKAEVQADHSPVCLQAQSMGIPKLLPVNAALLERSMHVDIETQIIDIDPNRIRVREQLRWHIMDVPLSRALLTMHRAILDFGEIQVQLNGDSVVPVRTPMFPGSSSEYETVQVTIPPGIGSFEMTVTYDWTRWADDGQVLGLEGLNAFDVDLVLPKSFSRGRADRLTVRNELRKPRIANYDVSLTYNRNLAMNWPWSLETPDPDIEAFSIQPGVNILPITTRKVTASSPTTTFQELVDRTWFQTWYTKNERTDRAVFRVQGGDEDLRIEVPEALMENLTVWVDGKITEFRTAGKNLIDVSVDADQPAHVIELQTKPDLRAPIGRLTTSLPRIAGADVMGQWYWHVVMPRNECMVTWPRKLTRAHRWDWSSMIPRRKSEMTLSELEEWSGARRSGGKIHVGSNEYLFGAMGEPDDALAIRTAPLPVYLLFIGGSVFVIGILFVYSKRRALVFLLLGLAVCSLIFLHPSYASLAGQLAAYGIILALLVQVLLWIVQHSPDNRLQDVAIQERSPASSWIRNLDQSRGETTTLEGGSSRFRNAQ